MKYPREKCFSFQQCYIQALLSKDAIGTLQWKFRKLLILSRSFLWYSPLIILLPLNEKISIIVIIQSNDMQRCNKILYRKIRKQVIWMIQNPFHSFSASLLLSLLSLNRSILTQIYLFVHYYFWWYHLICTSFEWISWYPIYQYILSLYSISK